ncbi:MAG: glycosyltransferase family 1 protein [Vicinamibacterales bacterium]
MRIVVDGGSWNNQRGFGRFTRELVGGLATHGRHQYTLVVDPMTDEATVPARLSVVRASLRRAPALAAAADGYRSPGDLLRMSRALASTPGDVLFFPCTYTYVPVFTSRPIVSGVHDTIAERYPSLIFPSRKARLFWTLKTRAALAQSARVITVSNYASRCVRETLGVSEARVRVINEAPAAVFRPVEAPGVIAAMFERLGLAPGARVVAYVGGLGPHKNLDRVFAAFASVLTGPGLEDAVLVLVGHHGTDVFHSAEAELRARASALCGKQVLFAGGLSDDELVLLLNGARALVLASLDEGFGLPAVEAAACGTPVIATRSSAMPEVLGDASLYVDPLSETSIADALRQVLTDDTLREQLGRVASVRARALTWQHAAETLERVFDELGPGGGHA